VAISIFAVMVTAKWIGFMPILMARGNIMGVVRITRDTPSKKHPRKRSTTLITIRNIYLSIPREFTKSMIILVIPRLVTINPSKLPPIMIK